MSDGNLLLLSSYAGHFRRCIKEEYLVLPLLFEKIMILCKACSVLACVLARVRIVCYVCWGAPAPLGMFKVSFARQRVSS